MSNPMRYVIDFIKKDYAVPLILAVVMLVLQLGTAGNYGMFRDEYYYLECSNHLDFGYVDFPPVTALLILLGRFFFGDTLFALRLLTAVSGFFTVLFTAAIARKLGGGVPAQALAALTILAAPVFLVFFGSISPSSFEMLIWTICIYILIRILDGGDPRLWLLFGLVAGIGLETKYTLLLYGFAAVVGLLLTKQRKHLASPWMYAGGLIAALILLPNLIWQFANGWPFVELVSNSQLYKNYPIAPHEFLLQLTVALNPVLLPLWVGGIVYLLFSKNAERFRPLAYIFIVAFIALAVQRSKFYYILPVMTLYLAAGAVWIERWSQRFKRKCPFRIAVVLATLSGLILLPFGAPVLPVEIFVDYSNLIGIGKTVKIERIQEVDLPQYYSDRFGWEDMVQKVERIYRQLPDEEREKCGILTGNYGQAAAIDFYGPKRGLPRAISGHNNYWLWGPSGYTGEVMICIGFNEESMNNLFENVERVDETYHPYARAEENNQPIYLCHGLKKPLAEIWPLLRFYI